MMISQFYHVACIFCLLAADGEPAKAQLDTAIDTWSQRVLAHSAKVIKQDEHNAIATALALMHAQRGDMPKALASAREVTDKWWLMALGSTVGHFLTEQEAVELVKGCPEQAQKDTLLKFIAIAQAAEGHYDVTDSLIRGMSADEQNNGWDQISTRLYASKRYQEALKALDKVTPRNNQEREAVERDREFLRVAIKKSAEPRRPQHDLAAAQIEVQNANDFTSKAEGWCRVAEIQLELKNNDKCREALRLAEAAADSIEAHLRVPPLVSVAETYQKLGDSENAGRVALEASAIPSETHEGTEQPRLSLDFKQLNTTNSKASLVKLLVQTRHWKEAIDIAQTRGHWSSLGAAAAGDDQLLAELEKCLGLIESDKGKTLVCAGVVSGLFERKKKEAQLPTEKPR